MSPNIFGQPFTMSERIAIEFMARIALHSKFPFKSVNKYVVKASLCECYGTNLIGGPALWVASN